jgi:hypothetical protein
MQLPLYYGCNAMSRSSRPVARATIAPIDSKALKKAGQSLAAKLVSEAEKQNGYVATFPDGQISIELEWIDPKSIAKAAIEAYLETAHLARGRRIKR